MIGASRAGTGQTSRDALYARRLAASAVTWLLMVTGHACAGDSAQPAPLWLVVGNSSLTGALQPLIEKRRADGFEAVVSEATVEQALAAAPRRPRYLLLVGDDETGKEREPWYLPSRQQPLYRWCATQPQRFASDAAWGDLDRDSVPDIAVGRIPARTPREVKEVVRKILEFERKQPTVQDLQLLVWAGAPMYNPMVDQWATGLLVASTINGAPAWACPWILSADPTQPYCGWPPDQLTHFCRRMQLGGVCQIMIGHGDQQGFYSMMHEGRYVLFTRAAAEAQLSGGPPTPPLVVLACSTGDFASASSCLAEDLLFLPAGPVAAVGATTDSHPLPNYLLGQALLWALSQPEDRLGDFWLKAARHALDAKAPIMERVLRDIEGKLEPNIDVPKLRRDALLMYVLLGDPATHLRKPQPLRVTTQRAAAAWRWTAQRPTDATRLDVSFQAAGRQRPEPGPPAPDRQTANAALDQANAYFAFEPVASFSAGEDWAGSVEQPGRLRLVASGPGKLYVAVVNLQPAAP